MSTHEEDNDVEDDVKDSYIVFDKDFDKEAQAYIFNGRELLDSATVSYTHLTLPTKRIV